jgi:GT2 family glycosyltransferase
MIDISVVTLNYKEYLLTTISIKKLLKSKGVNFEIIVVDNSCLETEAKELKKIKDKRVSVYVMEENLGCAAGYNFGINKAKGKYIFIVNNDTEIKDTRALSKMKMFMDTHKNVGAIQPKIKSLPKPTHFEYAGAAGGYMDFLGYPFCKGRIFNHTEKDRGQYNQSTPITWASTCAFFGRKNLLIKLGLFDPIYFAYAEEVDMSLKIWGSGYKVVYFPETEIYHKGEATWKKIRGKKTYLIHRNHLILYFKCLPLREIVLLLPLRVFFEFLSMINYVMNKSYLQVIPVFIANVHTLILLPKILERRKLFFQNYSKKTGKPIYRRSIVLEYFLRKKTRFSMLPQNYFYD